MNLFEKAAGHCEIRGKEVEILMVKLKKAKGARDGVRTPVRCQSASECPKSAFCRFVNPLTTRIPVKLDEDSKEAI